MRNNEKGFSLVIVVIFMSIAALFVGYLMGSWLIGFLVEDTDSQLADDTAEINQETVVEEINPDDIDNTTNQLTAPPAAEEIPEERVNVTEEQIEEPEPEEIAVEEETIEADPDIAGSFGVQIGAFSNYNNALSLQESMEEMGYSVFVTESSPHQVQIVGYSTREEAASAASDLEEEGYPGFIVIRE